MTNSTTRNKNTASSGEINDHDSGDESERGERLQKVLAAAGLGSRRSCEELILAGRVEVDRRVVSQLGARVLSNQEVRVDGEKLPHRRRVYYALHKPAGVISTNRDPSGRTRVIDLIDTHERLFAVGRLDKSSEGLILVTNDGALAQRLTHPKYEVEKTYRVEVAGHVTEPEIGKLQSGVHLAEGFAKVERVRIRKTYARSTDLEMVLKEGKNREVRRVLAAIGHKVMRLTRIAIGPLRLGDLPSGAHRPLSRDEVQHLREAASGGKRKKARPASGSGQRGQAKPYRPRTDGDRSAGRARQGERRGSPRTEKSLGQPIVGQESLGTIIGGKVRGAKSSTSGKHAGGYRGSTKQFSKNETRMARTAKAPGKKSPKRFGKKGPGRSPNRPPS